MNEVQEALTARIRARREALPAPDVCRSLRLSAGLSQRDVAEVCGVTPSAVTLWERGKRQPTGQRRAAYLDALSVMRQAS